MHPSVRLTDHQYFVEYEVKLVFVCVMFVPVEILVLMANWFHVSSVLLLHHVAVMVSLSLSEHITYRLGVVLMSVLVLPGLSPVCVGSWLMVRWYVLLFHPFCPSVRLTLQ